MVPIFTVVRTFTTLTPATAIASVASDTVLAVSGFEIAGAAGGLIAGVGGLIGTYVALKANVASARRAYQLELQAQYDRGVKDTKNLYEVQLEAKEESLKELKEDRDYWRSRFSRLADSWKKGPNDQR